MCYSGAEVITRGHEEDTRSWDTGNILFCDSGADYRDILAKGEFTEKLISTFLYACYFNKGFKKW